MNRQKVARELVAVARELAGAGPGDVKWRLIDLQEEEEELKKEVRRVSDDVAYSFYAHPTKKEMENDPDRAMKAVEDRLKKTQLARRLIKKVQKLLAR